MPNWKEFKIETENLKLKDLGVESRKVRRVLIDLFEVSAFYETEQDDTDEEITYLCLKSGESFNVFESYDNIKSLIPEYENS